MPPDDEQPTALTPRQEIRALGQIVTRVERLTPAGRTWLKSWMEGNA